MTRTLSASPRWLVTSALFGGMLWLAAPAALRAAPGFGSIEHVFLLLPLVLAPLALELLSAMLDADAVPGHWAHAAARQLQPLAAVLVLVSFGFPVGPVSGCLALGWFLLAVLVALGGAARLRARKRARGSHVSVIAALVFLVVGAVWLLLFRFGLRPRGFAPLTVFLAALHFHYSGFTFQLLVAATGRRLGEVGSRLCRLQRGLALSAIVALPLIAAGNLVGVPLLKFAGVVCIVLAALALAFTSASAGLRAPSPPARRFLCVSAASLGMGMFLAGAYGIGELIGAAWIGVPRMVVSHGLLNALGFTACGILGQLCWKQRQG